MLMSAMHDPRDFIGRRNMRLSGKRTALRVLLVFGLASLVFSCATARAPVPDFSLTPSSSAWAALGDYVKAEIKAAHIKGGCAISVADARGELWAGGFGEADHASGRAFSTDTISNAGSVSKLFTATAVMKLVEAGKLDLDAPIATWLPELKPKTRFPDARPITIRDIMTHHSGLPTDYLGGWRSEGPRPADYPESFLQDTRLASSMYVANPPGVVLSYSNLAMGLLGIVVERASGMDFESYCRKEIFEPLGMKDTSFVLPMGFETDPRYATGFVAGKTIPIPYLRDMPAAALDTTVDDLARFAASYLAAFKGEPGILSQATVRAMFTAQNSGVAADLDARIGLNFFIVSSDSLRGEMVLGHGGEVAPFYSIFLLLPERGLAVSILVNSKSFRLISGLAIPSLRAALAATGQAPFAPESKRKAAPQAPIDASIAGTYASSMGLIKVERKGGGFEVNLAGRWFDAVGHEDGLITLEKRVLGIKLPIKQLEGMAIRPLEVEGRPALGIGSLATATVLATRIEASPIPDAWKARYGSYLGKNLDLGMEVLGRITLGVDRETGILTATMGQGGLNIALPLRPVSDTEVIVEGLGRNLGETIEAAGDNMIFEGLVLERK